MFRTPAPGAFGAREEQLLGLLAGPAGILLGAARTSEAPQELSASLQGALAGRSAVEAATGMLMERHGTDRASARRILLAGARERRTPVVQLARRLVERTPGPVL